MLLMFPKKHITAADRGYRKELEYLNARKSALDSLIQSLEDYDRFRSAPTDHPKRKTS
jgi:hypothetical protein